MRALRQTLPKEFQMDGKYWVSLLDSRLRRRRALGLAAATALSTSLLAACGSDKKESTSDKSSLVTQAADTTKQAKRGGTFNSTVLTDPQNFEVAVQNSTATVPLALAYNTLTA